MARSYRPVLRGQGFLLPPDMREWLPDDHLLWVVVEIVEQLDRSVLHARRLNTGLGRAAYDPDMLLALLIYAYCQGVRSSRQIGPSWPTPATRATLTSLHRGPPG